MAEAPTDAPVIDTHGLAKRYGHTDALIDLTLRVEPGEVFGFLGPNGAGKTTAVKLLLGLARPSCGSGTVLDSALGDRAVAPRGGGLPELFRYQTWLRAREVLELHARLAGGPDRSRPPLGPLPHDARPPHRPATRSRRSSPRSASSMGRAPRSAASRRGCSSVLGSASRCSARRRSSSSTG